MIDKLRHNENSIWFVLLLITLLMWGLIDGAAVQAGVVVLVALSSLKVYLIGVSFMEISAANKMFQRFFYIWVTAVASMVILLNVSGT